MSSSSKKVSTTQTTTSFSELRRRSRTAASYSTAARMSSLSSSLSGGIKDSQHRPSSSSAPTAASSSSSSSVSDRLVPSANLNENRDCVRVLVDLPGVPAQDVHVTLEHGVLEISGTRRIMSDDGSTCLKRQKFGRRYAIDVDVVDVAKATAVLSNGVLTVRAPKKDERSQSLVRIPVVDASAVAMAPAVNPGPDEAAVAAAALVPVRDEAERVEPTTQPTLIPNVPPPTNRSSSAASTSTSSSSSLSAKSSLSDSSSSPKSLHPHHYPSPPLPPPPKRRVKASVTAADPIRAYVTQGRHSSQHQAQQEQQPQPLPPMPSESSSSASSSSASSSSSSTSTSSDATPTTGNPRRPPTTTLEEEEEASGAVASAAVRS